MTKERLHIDPQLLTKCIRGDEKSLYELYRQCYRVLYAVCKRYANDEDEISVLLNNAFIKMVKAIKRYDSKVPFEAWIRRIAINNCIDHFRKHRKYKQTILYPENASELQEHQFDFNLADRMFDAEQLLTLIRRLPPMSARVFNLAAIDGYTHLEISEMLTISIGTSKWHLSNARKLLQEMMQKEMNARKEVKEKKIKRVSGI